MVLAIVCALLALGAWRALARPRTATSSILFGLATVTLLIIVPELSLRLAGFRYGSRMQFGYPDPEQFMEFEPDADLFWKLPASRADVNALGFIGPEVEMPVPKGVRRALFLGDSCTQQGHPDRVAQLLRTVSRDSIECINLSMAGYSSYQGRVLTSTTACHLGAEVAVVCFGWNDHWLAVGQIDAEKHIPVGLEKAYRASRLLQLVRRVLVRIAGSRMPPSASPRVPMDQYAANLRAIIATFRQAGTQVVLTTAPTAMYFRGVPTYLLDKYFAVDAASVTRLHAAYNDTVRAVARSEGVACVDLEAALNTPAADRCFHPDGIHITPRGREAVATRIAAQLCTTWLGGDVAKSPVAIAAPEP